MTVQADKQTDKEKSQDQSKVKIKVDGQETEVTQEELIALAQQGKDYTKKTQALSEKEKALRAEEERVKGLKSIVDEMEANPKLKETLNKVYSDFKSGKISKSDENKDRNLKLLDKKIEEASDPEAREQLRAIRQIISEETGSSELKEEIAKLREEISGIKTSSLISLTDRIEGQLKDLEKEFGKELVDKYRKDISSTAAKYPTQSIKKLLYHYANDDEIETALLDKAKRKAKDEDERKKRGADISDNQFTAKTPLSKDKAGRVTFDSIKARVLERLGQK